MCCRKASTHSLWPCSLASCSADLPFAVRSFVSARPARPQQAEHGGGVAVVGGNHQRGVAVAVLQTDLRAALEQHVDHPLVAVEGGVNQRGGVIAALHVDLSATLEQQLDHSLVAVEGGAHQRGAAGAVLQVDLRAALKQQLDRPLVALLGGKHQRGDAAHIA